jgi:phosphatidylglycerol:prolipoprotein diacylglycerol transferase
LFAVLLDAGSHWFTYPHVDPVAIHIYKDFGIRWYGLSYVIGAILVYLQLQSKSSRARTGLTVEQAQEFIVYTMIGIILGGRIFFLIADMLTPLSAGGHSFTYYISNPIQIIAIWTGGMAFHGGLLGGIAGAWLYTRRIKLSILKVLDEAVLWLPVAILLTRITNFINDELPGRVTDSPIGILFPNYQGYRYPSQLFEGVGMVLIVLPLVWLVRSRPDIFRPGAVFWMFIAGYGLVRTVVEFYREPGIIFLGLTGAQYLTIAMVILGVMMIWLGQRQPMPAATAQPKPKPAKPRA